jgi:nitrate/nitrite transporter NarK
MPTALSTLELSASSAAMGTVTVNGAFILFALPLSILLPRINARNLLLVMFGSGILIAVGLGLAGSNFTIVFILVGLAGFGIGGQQLASPTHTRRNCVRPPRDGVSALAGLTTLLVKKEYGAPLSD